MSAREHHYKRWRVFQWRSLKAKWYKAHLHLGFMGLLEALPSGDEHLGLRPLHSKNCMSFHCNPLTKKYTTRRPQEACSRRNQSKTNMSWTRMNAVKYASMLFVEKITHSTFPFETLTAYLNKKKIQKMTSVTWNVWTCAQTKSSQNGNASCCCFQSGFYRFWPYCAELKMPPVEDVSPLLFPSDWNVPVSFSTTVFWEILHL